MSKTKFLFSIKVLILLSPLPFACDAPIWSPLFHLILLVVSGIALGGIRQSFHFLYEKRIRLLSGLFVFYMVFQLIPLPRFLLKAISPLTVELLDKMRTKPVVFHSLSLVPADTLLFGIELLALGLLFWVLVHLNLTKQDIYSLVQYLAVSVFFQAGLGTIKWLLRSDRFFLFFYETGNTARLMNGTFWHSDHLAFYLQMIVPLLVGWIMVKLFVARSLESLGTEWWIAFIKEKMLIFNTLAVLGAAGGILLTKSLSGSMILFLSLLFMALGFIYFRSKPGSISPSALRWLTLGVIGFSLLFALQNSLAGISRSDREGHVRADIWQESLKLAGDFPVFGAGYGNFKHVAYQIQTKKPELRLSHPRNGYLKHWIEGGIVGFGMFFSLLGFMLFSLIKMWLGRRHPEVQIMGLAFLVSIFLAGFHEIFDFALGIPVNAFVFVVVSALGFKMVLYKREIRDEA